MTLPPVGGGQNTPTAFRMKGVLMAARLLRETTPTSCVTSTLQAEAIAGAGPTRCHHSQTSRVQSPLNLLYKWGNADRVAPFPRT